MVFTFNIVPTAPTDPAVAAQADDVELAARKKMQKANETLVDIQKQIRDTAQKEHDKYTARDARKKTVNGLRASWPSSTYWKDISAIDDQRFQDAHVKVKSSDEKYEESRVKLVSSIQRLPPFLEYIDLQDTQIIDALKVVVEEISHNPVHFMAQQNLIDGLVKCFTSMCLK